jgi:hypothetical protein
MPGEYRDENGREGEHKKRLTVNNIPSRSLENLEQPSDNFLIACRKIGSG